MLRYLNTRLPWTNVYGLARTLLAAATGLILLLNPAWVLFRPGSGEQGIVNCNLTVERISVFCVAGPHLDLARLGSVIALLIVASGWRPRYTGILHWWISFSFYSSARVTDGGEQAAALFTLLLIPITLTDSRKWHWQTLQPGVVTSKAQVARMLVAWIGSMAVQIQLAFIYLDACVEKLRVPEWQDGTIMYYVVRDDLLGAPHFLQLLVPLTSTAFVVFLAWPSLLLELSLATNILMRPSARRVLFFFGVFFHSSIAILIGIPSFALVMIGALLMGVVPNGWTLRDLLAPLRYERLRSLVGRRGIVARKQTAPA